MENKKETTNKLLAESLKQLMHHTAFEKITIKNITDAVGLIRPTFYNHFSDKYELIEWIFYNDIIAHIKALIEENMIQEAILLMLTKMEQDKEFYIKAIRIKGQNSFEGILYKTFYELFLNIFKFNLDESKIHSILITPENLSKYYANGITFIIISWIEDGMRVPAKEVANIYLDLASKSVDDFIKKY